MGQAIPCEAVTGVAASGSLWGGSKGSGLEVTEWVRESWNSLSCWLFRINVLPVRGERGMHKENEGSQKLEEQRLRRFSFIRLGMGEEASRVFSLFF